MIQKPITIRTHSIAAVVWFLFLSLSLFLNIQNEKSDAAESARIMAHTAFEKDVLYRRWNAKHGGVYARVTELTQPNPYLNTLEREIITPSNKTLTKINPAFMTRQVHELGKDTLGVVGHITSLNPIRPENAPVPWEAEALKLLETGIPEFTSIENVQGEKYFRFLRPLLTEQGCLSCHAVQGYKVGDIRGGISISVPMKPFNDMAKKHITLLSVIHGILFFLGLAALRFAAFHIRMQIEVREKTETQLQTSEERHRLFFENTPIGMVHYNSDGIITEVNEAILKTFGSSREKVLGFDIRDVPSGDFAETILKSLKGQFAHFEGEYTSVTGKKTSYIKASIIPILKNGKMILGVGLVEDITEHRLAQEELRLKEYQLQRSQKMETVGILAGGVAHEFNNLLYIISGNTQLLLDDATPGSKEMLQAIFQSTQRGADLVKQLMAFSRKTEILLNTTFLNDEIQKIMRMLDRVLPRMIDTKLDLDENLFSIKADGGQIEQVVMNVCINARDAMPDGGTLTIKTENGFFDEALYNSPSSHSPDFKIGLDSAMSTGLKTGRCVILTISDTGTGMDSKTQEHIFDPFFTTKEIGKGTGLGLSVIYGIIQSHGGYIACESQPDEGTTFKIYFPFVAEEQLVPTLDSDAANRASKGTETILLVDDEKDVINITRAMLSKLGYDVITADSGESAFGIYLEKYLQIDLVVIDLGMPGMGGRKCIEKLLYFNSKAKILVATGYLEESLIKDIKNLGAKGYVAKPFTAANASRAIREILDKDE